MLRNSLLLCLAGMLGVGSGGAPAAAVISAVEVPQATAIKLDGTLAWTFRTGDRIVSSPLVDVKGAVLFGSQDDRVYALEADGRLRWSVELDGDVDSSPSSLPTGRSTSVRTTRNCMRCARPRARRRTLLETRAHHLPR